MEDIMTKLLLAAITTSTLFITGVAYADAVKLDYNEKNCDMINNISAGTGGELELKLKISWSSLSIMSREWEANGFNVETRKSTGACWVKLDTPKGVQKCFISEIWKWDYNGGSIVMHAKGSNCG